MKKGKRVSGRYYGYTDDEIEEREAIMRRESFKIIGGKKPQKRETKTTKSNTGDKTRLLRF